MNRTQLVAAATAGLMVVGGGALVASSANATPETTSGPVLLKSFNGSDPKTKAFVYEGQFQTFLGTSNPWTFLEDGPPFGTPIMAQPEATVVTDQGEVEDATPVHFGGRQRIGVQSPGETSGGQFDSISPGETLILQRGDLLIEQGAFFDGLDVKLNGRNATAVITAFLGDNQVHQATVSVNKSVQADGLLAGKTFDRLEFTSDEGSYGLKGFNVLKLSVVKDATFEPVPDLRQPTTITREGEGEYTVVAECGDRTDELPGTIAFGDANAIFFPVLEVDPAEPGTLGFSVVPGESDTGCFYRINGDFDQAGFIEFDPDDDGPAPLEQPPPCDGEDMLPTGKKACFNTFAFDVEAGTTVFELYGDFDARGRLFR